jgi:DNA-binding transcriptional MerR regulator
MAEDRTYTSKDVKEKAGLSYRQLNDWESRGAMPPGGREGERGWRRFSPKELFALMVCAEIRERYGIPVEKVRYVLECMLRKDADHFQVALELMSYGLNIFLLTDFKETFVMDSDLEFEDYMTYGYFRADRPQSYIFMRLNDIAARLLESPEKVKSSVTEGLYAVKYESRAAITVKNQPEIDLLQALRSGKFDQVSVKVKDGEIRLISLEGDVPQDDLTEQADGIRVKSENEFETFEVSRMAGKVTKARRKLPKKYGSKDNRAVFFAGIHNREKPEDESNA